MNPAKKPTDNKITINGDVYLKIKDEEWLDCSFYRNKEKQRCVKVEWSNFFKCWYIELIGKSVGRFDLSAEITVPEKIIPTYFTAEQKIALEILITRELLKSW